MKAIFTIIIVLFYVAKVSAQNEEAAAPYYYDGKVSTVFKYSHDKYNLPEWKDGQLLQDAKIGFFGDFLIDSAGFFYLPTGKQIKKIGPKYLVSTFSGIDKYGYKDGKAAEAEFDGLHNLLLDNQQNIILLDGTKKNQSIRKVLRDGSVSTIFKNDELLKNQIISSRKVKQINNIAVDRYNNIYINYKNGNCIFKISAEKSISIFSGSTRSGQKDGKSSECEMNEPSQMIFDKQNNMFFLDNEDKCIRRIGTNGDVFTILKFHAINAIAFDKLDNMLITTGNYSVGDNSVYLLTPKETMTTSLLTMSQVRLLAGGNQNKRITSDGTFYGGHGDGTGNSVIFESPFSIATDPNGYVYIADGNGLRRLSITRNANTVAKPKTNTYTGTDKDFRLELIAGNSSNSEGLTHNYKDAFGTDAGFGYRIFGITSDNYNNLFVADASNSLIRKVSSNGDVTTYAGTLKKKGSGFLQTITPQKGYKDGPANEALFDHPFGVVIDSKNNLFVTDLYNHRIRKITPEGIVSTFAGSGETGKGKGGFKDGNGSAAMFCEPMGIAIDGQDNLYIADAGNGRIRKITPDGTVVTFVGSSEPCKNDKKIVLGQGGFAKLGRPTGIAIDQQENLVVSDPTVNIILKIDKSGNVGILAGSGKVGKSDGPAKNATFFGPLGIAIDKTGNCYVADELNARLRKIDVNGMVTTLFGVLPGETVGGIVLKSIHPVSLTFNKSGELIVGEGYQINKLLKK